MQRSRASDLMSTSGLLERDLHTHHYRRAKFRVNRKLPLPLAAERNYPSKRSLTQTHGGHHVSVVARYARSQRFAHLDRSRVAAGCHTRIKVVCRP